VLQYQCPNWQDADRSELLAISALQRIFWKKIADFPEVDDEECREKMEKLLCAAEFLSEQNIERSIQRYSESGWNEE
jgi:hypothetical protein